MLNRFTIGSNLWNKADANKEEDEEKDDDHGGSNVYFVQVYMRRRLIFDAVIC